MSFMGLDIGTSGCKSLVISDSGEVLCRYSASYNLIHNGQGRSELDPGEVWSALCTIIRRTALDASNHGDPIRAIAPSILGEACIPVATDGRPLSLSTTSADMRGTDDIQDFSKIFGAQRLFQITGQPCNPMFTLAKLLYWKHQEPNLFSKVWKFFCWEDFFFYKLCGQCVTDYSLASRMLLFDLQQKKWSEEILKVAGINPNLVSEIVPPGTIVGSVKSEINNQYHLNLPDHCVLVAGGWDQACAALGAGVIAEGKFLNNTGTTECAAAIAKAPPTTTTLYEGRYQIVPHVFPDLYLITGGSLTGGVILKWYQDNLANSAIEERAKKQGNIYETILNKLSPIPSPLYVFPYFSGAGNPTFNPDAQGIFWGLTLTTTKEDLVKGLIDGLGYELRRNIEFLRGCGIKIDCLHLTGGASRSEFWVQQKCNVTGCDALVPNINDASAFGAALIAGYASGAFNTYDDIISNIIAKSKWKHPQKEIQSQYTKKYLQYQKLSQIVHTAF
jgi:xylulokinase